MGSKFVPEQFRSAIVAVVLVLSSVLLQVLAVQLERVCGGKPGPPHALDERMDAGRGHVRRIVRVHPLPKVPEFGEPVLGGLHRFRDSG